MKIDVLKRKRDIIKLYNLIMSKRRVEPISYIQKLTVRMLRRYYKENISKKKLMNIVYSDVRLSEIEQNIEIEQNLLDNIEAARKSKKFSVRDLSKSLNVSRSKIQSRL